MALTKQERLDKLRSVYQGDMLKALSEQRSIESECGAPADFASGYAHALLSMSLRNLTSLAGTMKRVLEDEEVVGDVLGFYQISGETIRVAHELLNQSPPEDLLKTIEETEERFLKVLQERTILREIKRSMSRKDGE